MSRLFRLYEKKRGHRSTGSTKLGSLGEALFFGVFFAAGCGFLGLMFWTIVVPEWRANRQFKETTCRVIAKKLSESKGDDGTTYRPEITVRYRVGQRDFETTTYDAAKIYVSGKRRSEAILAQFDVGKQYPCWYDPINPAKAVLVQGYSWFMYLFLLIPFSFIAIGAAGVVYTVLHLGASTERRASLVQKRAAQLDVFDAGLEPGDCYPNVPGHANLTNSPGTTLAYRLPISPSQGWKLFGILAAAVFWNAIVAIFVVAAVHAIVVGEQQGWWLALFCVPFLSVGAWLVYQFVREALVITGVGTTRLEISHHPLRPGETCEVLLSQAGRLTMNSLELLLACEETATYRQGTDTRRDRQKIHECSLFRREAFEIHQGIPCEERFVVRIPETAMHSFKADHNEILWSMIVRGDVEGWPNYERVFAIVVYPALSASRPR